MQRALLFLLGGCGVLATLIGSWLAMPGSALSAEDSRPVSARRAQDSKQSVEADQDQVRRKKALAALCAAMQTNAKYCQDWLEAGDFASLQKTAHGMMLVKDLLLAESDDQDWQQQVDELNQSVSSLLSSAGEEDQAACEQLITQIQRQGAALAALNPELKAEVSYTPRNDIGRIMDLLDGTYADAKAALIFDDGDTAQREAWVLWRIGCYLESQGARGTSADKWDALAEAFSSASLRAAELTSAEPSEIKAALKLARDQCENCHNRE